MDVPSIVVVLTMDRIESCILHERVDRDKNASIQRTSCYVLPRFLRISSIQESEELKESSKKPEPVSFL